jgi:hypothetical protein
MVGLWETEKLTGKNEITIPIGSLRNSTNIMIMMFAHDWRLYYLSILFQILSYFTAPVVWLVFLPNSKSRLPLVPATRLSQYGSLPQSSSFRTHHHR